MKIIVYTGSFNPITNGHVFAMKAAIDAVNADKGLFVMVHEKYLIKKMYLKNKSAFVLPDETRKHLISAVCENDDRFDFGGRQIGGPNPSTIKTLNSIKNKYKDSQIYLLMGADKLRNLSKWDDSLDILNNYNIILSTRKNYNVDEIINNDEMLSKYKNKFTLVYPPVEALNISSSDVREKVLANEPYDSLMPLKAYEILKQVNISKFKELTFEDRIYCELNCNGLYGSKNACKLVYASNSEMFKTWNEDLLGSKSELLDNTKVYKHEFNVNVNNNYNTLFDCVNSDCADVALELVNDGYNTAILNLASNVSPGGGYHHGTNAQEECLCQMSTLSQSLYQFGDLKYKHIREANLPNYSNVYPMDINYGGIFTKTVRFFRNNKSKYYSLRDKPFSCSVITVASLSNRLKNSYTNDERGYFNSDGTFTNEGYEIEANKIRTIYRIALDNGIDGLVLGAFGCGVYNLLPVEVSKLFLDILNEDEFKGNFKKIVFAIYEGKGLNKKQVGRDGKFKPFYDLFS